MIEAIWPVSPSPRIGKRILSLRTFVEVILQRSQTSYSTLRVAMYYLILIKPHVLKSRFDTEHSQSFPTLQCGRRMFLAALALASKYLQDNSLSALTWSHISGLDVAEFNLNEKAFLAIVEWRVHLTKDIYERWIDIVTQNILGLRPDWKKLVIRLTPNIEDWI